MQVPASVRRSAFQAPPLNPGAVGGGGTRRYRRQVWMYAIQIQVVPRTFYPVRPEPRRLRAFFVGMAGITQALFEKYQYT